MLKQKLAQLTAMLVSAGDMIFIESASSNALLARVLSQYMNITIVTTSLYIAELLKDSKSEVIVEGGLLQTKTENVVGSLTKLCN